MKSKCTPMIRLLIIGMFSSLAILSSTFAQNPTELLPSLTESSLGVSSLIDCNTAPVITCPSTYFGCPSEDTTPNITGYATAVAGDQFCEAPIVTYTDEIISEGPCAGQIEIHRMWTATYPDESYNYLFADCTQLIFLRDEDGPAITGCPENILTTPDQNCEAIATWTLPTATDDCGLASFETTHESGSAFPQGETVVTYTATDECGNTSTCSFSVTVDGTCCFAPPTITCADDFLGCPSDGHDPAITGTTTAVAASDMCGDPVVAYTDEVVSTGPCVGATTIERTWTASYDDNPDLTSTCIQMITLSDNKDPLLTNVPTDITIAPSDDCTAIATWDPPVATDNCSIPTLESNFVSGSTFGEGVTEVVYTATDECGNIATASFIVSVTSCCTAPPAITCPSDFNGCPDTDISIAVQSNCDATPTTYTGWAVATCNAEAGTDDPVGVIYDTRHTANAPSSQDWAPSITDLHPSNWTLTQIGQVFGIAIGSNDEVYLGASDIYDTGYDTDPFGPGQIFVAHADNDFFAEPLVDLNNSGGALNGIGNLVYDRINHQLFASNLEDGKIYRIATDGTIIDTYDPWSADDGSAGIVSASEQVWGIGLNTESGSQKLYFARIDGSTREMYSITLEGGAFPDTGSESVAIASIPGVGARIADIAFSDDGLQMIFAERGTKFTTGAHDAQMLNYTLASGSWQMDLKYYVGAWVTEEYPNIVVEPGENSAGGVSFGPTDVNSSIEGCDQLVWTTMNYFRTDDGSLYYGIQGIDAAGNNPNTAATNPNTETDIIIDFDGVYDNFVQKGDLGDVEIFHAGGSLIAAETGMATATSGPGGCGSPLITYTDEVVSEGSCGSTVINREWIATDSNNADLSSSCTQVITLEDTQSPVISDMPADITIAPNSDCQGVATWTTPTADDNCGIATFTSSLVSGSAFDEGSTTVTYTATDACGLSTSASFVVTVSACCTAPPTITCPADHQDCIGTSIGPNITGTATAIPGSTTCNSPTVTYNDVVVSAGPCDGAISIIRTWTATDPENGLTATCDQSIILVDDVAPVLFDCPADITVTTSTPDAAVSWIEPTADDGCSLEWIMGDHAPGDVFPIGSTTVTYTAIDDCGNVTPCSFVVTVESAGTITCPDDIIVECGGSAGTPITWELPVLETGCTDCQAGDSIPGFIYMGSLDGSLYYCSTSPSASASATATATSLGGHLATINSQEENDLLAGFLNNQCALIGLNDSAQEGTFAWGTGEPLSYTNWAHYQPNNENGNQDCVLLCNDGWNDTQCGVAYEFIMEIPCTAYQQTSGLPNGSDFPVGTDTITYVVTDACGTSLTCSFTVTVEESVQLVCPGDYTFTCPAGASNVIAYWNTPELESCCTDCTTGDDNIAGYMYMGSHGGSKYYCSMSNATWPNANIQAQYHGGHLAEINDAEENAFLANILTLQRAWIGLNDATNEGQFKWSTGKALTYTNWYPNQPNNTNNNQDYVSMLNDGQWNDEYNHLAMEYIMEVPCSSVTQIGGPSSGSLLPIGVTTVTYAGQDACGNVDTCSFDITINGTTGCQSYGQDSWYTWIENFGLGDYSNPSGNNGGYADYTDDDCIEVTSGQPYAITLTPGFASNFYTVYWKVWIDYNQDGDYLDAGEYIAYGAGHEELNGVINISTTCLMGETSMRVSMKYGAYPSGPCAVFSHGEVEDYCINISAGGTGGGDFTSTINVDEPVLLGANSTSSAIISDLDADIAAGIFKAEVRSNQDLQLEVFPNPTTDILHVEMKGAQQASFILLDNTGKQVQNYKLDFTSGRQSIDLSDLQNGIYMLKSTDSKHSKKVLVQH